MSLIQRLFGPNITRLEQKGDVEALIEVLGSEARTELRLAAVEALTRLGGERSLEMLVESIGHTEPPVAEAAERSVRSLGSTAAGQLTAALGGPAAARALAVLLELGQSALEPLGRAMESSDEQVRRLALDGLLELGRRLEGPEARETVFRSLLAALGDRSPSCRQAAASGLDDLGDARAAKALAARLKDGDEEVREACRQALAAIGEPATLDLVDALADRNVNSRRLAAGLLGELAGSAETESIETVLIALMNGAGDSDAAVREASIKALKGIDDSATDTVAMEKLAVLDNPELGDREMALERLEQMLEHANLSAAVRERMIERLEVSRPSDPS